MIPNKELHDKLMDEGRKLMAKAESLSIAADVLRDQAILILKDADSKFAEAMSLLSDGKNV